MDVLDDINTSGKLAYPEPVVVANFDEFWAKLGIGTVRAIPGRPGEYSLRRGYSVAGPVNGTVKLSPAGNSTVIRLRDGEIELPIPVIGPLKKLLRNAIAEMVQYAVQDAEAFLAEKTGVPSTAGRKPHKDYLDVDVEGTVTHPVAFVAKNIDDLWSVLGLGVLSPLAGPPGRYAVSRGYALVGPESGQLTLTDLGASTNVHLTGRLGLPIRVPGIAKGVLQQVIKKLLVRTTQESQRFLDERQLQQRQAESTGGLAA